MPRLEMQDRTLNIKLGTSQAATILGLSKGGNLSPQQQGHCDDSDAGMEYLCNSVESGIVSGFQLASANGPLCDEPMWGLIFEVPPSSCTLLLFLGSFLSMY